MQSKMLNKLKFFDIHHEEKEKSGKHQLVNEHDDSNVSSFTTDLESEKSVRGVYQDIYQITIRSSVVPEFESKYLPQIKALSDDFGSRHQVCRLWRSIEEKNEKTFLLVVVFDSNKDMTEFSESTKLEALFNEVKAVGITTERLVYGASLENKHLNRVQPAGSHHAPGVRPPPKWKIYIVLCIGIFTSLVLLNLPGSFVGKMTDQEVPFGWALFLTLLIVVIFIMYVFSPLFTSLPFVSEWIKAPRIKETEMSPIHKVLDSGLDMFKSPPYMPLIQSLQKRMDTMENRLHALRKRNFELAEKLELGESPEKEKLLSSPISKNEDVVASALSSKGVDSHGGVITVSATHFIKWECIDDFQSWRQEMVSYMQTQPGFLSFTCIDPMVVEDPYINQFSFDSVESLANFSQQEKRITLLAKLDSMVQVNKNVICINRPLK